MRLRTLVQLVARHPALRLRCRREGHVPGAERDSIGLPAQCSWCGRRRRDMPLGEGDRMIGLLIRGVASELRLARDRDSVLDAVLDTVDPERYGELLLRLAWQEGRQ